MLPFQGVKITLTEMRAPNIPYRVYQVSLKAYSEIVFFFSEMFLFKNHLTFGDTPIY